VKKVVLLTLVLLISIAFVSSSFAFSKAPPEKASPEGAPATEKAPAAEKVPAPKQRAAKPKVSGFVGTVTMVDANLIDVWGKKAEVAFDASNPELKGYNAIGDVMVGDIVAVKYTKDGVTITKLKGTAKTKASEEKKVEIAKKARSKVAPEKAAPKQRAAKPKASGFVGTVTMVDASLLQVKGKKAEVAFDASNPELKGYNAIGDVMVGDTVAVKYTKDGVTITKLKGTAKTKASEEKKVEIAKKAPKEETVRLFTCKGKGPCTVSVNKVIE
jgi:colicin import membrane protein/neurofilament heavy polypeptide